MFRSTSQRFRLVLGLVILCSCIGCDQATKSIALSTLRDQPPRSYFADTVRLGLAQNPGGFLSVGANLPDGVRTKLFVTTNCVMLLSLLAFLLIKRNTSSTVFLALVCVLAGGIGNLVDRMTNNGLVIDFLNLGIGPVRTGVFNVADVAITFGAILIGYVAMKGRSEKPNEDSSPLQAE
jgi:signal peptidase II